MKTIIRSLAAVQGISPLSPLNFIARSAGIVLIALSFLFSADGSENENKPEYNDRRTAEMRTQSQAPFEARVTRPSPLPSTPTILNLSGYKFIPLTDLAAHHKRLLDLTRTTGIKGTILLSPEGINLFVAGLRPQLEGLLSELRAIPGLADLAVKESPSTAPPFDRMLVKIKKEIIAFGVEGPDPAQHPTPKLPARTLKQWLDEGRPVTLLDTRNDYEIRLGTFRGAISTGISRFRDFPAAAQRLPEALKKQPIVMFCTGGIRCEKAGPYLESAGFNQVLQLDGGILKYFEDCGVAHYDGQCFVFDQRVGLDPSLQATGAVLCVHCQIPLTEQEQRDPRYEAGKSCPQCSSSPKISLPTPT